jgi:hypothetical protein
MCERVECANNAEDESRFLHRLRLHSELDVKENLRLYIEGANATSHESDRGFDEEDLDLLSGFCELYTDGLKLRAGRQQLEFVSSRRISVSDSAQRAPDLGR